VLKDLLPERLDVKITRDLGEGEKERVAGLKGGEDR
jgi:hypothetical protein